MRLGVQEQGRAAAARRGGRLPAVAARHPAGQGHRPRDRRAEIARKADDDEPFAALAFKIMNDPFVGQLTFFRVYSGTLEAGSTVFNATKGKRERIGRLLRMHANKREEIKERRRRRHRRRRRPARHHHRRHALRREAPDPARADAVPRAGDLAWRSSRKTKADQDKLGVALQRLAVEDPTFRVHTDEETGQTIISGMGELHLEIIVDRMKREFKVEANVGKPQVAYRETITADGRARSTSYIKQTGGHGQYGHVKLAHRAERARQGLRRSTTRSSAASSRKEFIPAVEKGVAEALRPRRARRLPADRRQGRALRRQLPRRRLVGDGLRAGRLDGAARGGAARAQPILLEPIMAVEVVTPEEYMGAVIGDLNARRGKIIGMEPQGWRTDGHRRGSAVARCSATRPSCARRRRAAPPTRWSSATTRRSRRQSPRRSSMRMGA